MYPVLCVLYELRMPLVISLRYERNGQLSWFKSGHPCPPLSPDNVRRCRHISLVRWLGWWFPWYQRYYLCMIRLQANNKKTNKKKNDMSNIKELERKMMGGGWRERRDFLLLIRQVDPFLMKWYDRMKRRTFQWGNLNSLFRKVRDLWKWSLNWNRSVFYFSYRIRCSNRTAWKRIRDA